MINIFFSEVDWDTKCILRSRDGVNQNNVSDSTRAYRKTPLLLYALWSLTVAIDEVNIYYQYVSPFLRWAKN